MKHFRLATEQELKADTFGLGAFWYRVTWVSDRNTSRTRSFRSYRKARSDLQQHRGRARWMEMVVYTGRYIGDNSESCGYCHENGFMVVPMESYKGRRTLRHVIHATPKATIKNLPSTYKHVIPVGYVQVAPETLGRLEVPREVWVPKSNADLEIRDTPNKYPGKCLYTGAWVEAGKGFLARQHGRWGVVSRKSVTG